MYSKRDYRVSCLGLLSGCYAPDTHAAPALAADGTNVVDGLFAPISSASLAAAMRDLPVIRRKCSVIPFAIAKVALKVGKLTFATDCTNVCNPVLYGGSPRAV